MFTAPKVEVFMNNASLSGKKDKKVVRFIFYITPITHYLMAQISPDVAGTLFHDDGHGDMKPALGLPDASLDVGNIALQRMSLHPSDDDKMDKYGAMLDRVELSDLGFRKIYPDDPNFSLIFRAEAPLDKLAVELMQKYYQEKLFITFEAMQGTMFPSAETECEFCEDPPVAKDSKDSFLCQKHVKKGIGEIEWLNKKETPKEALARVTKEAASDPEDMSHANKPKGGKRKAAVS